jgi:outer membrane receptor for ferrienterochelin and colicin
MIKYQKLIYQAMKRKIIYILQIAIISIFLSINSNAKAQDNSDTLTMNDLFDMSLEDLMQMEVKITSINKSINQLDAPGIISIITEDEILSSGARDIIDVLQLVPGFSFAMDTQGQVGLINRGNWAHENKILFMIDGLTLNEQMYSTMALGNRIAIENIYCIEIIRGPGSAIYGGNAEMSVINIITKSGKQINGIYGGMSHGSTENKLFFRDNIYLSAGKKYKNLEFSVFGKYGNGFRSDKEYTDLYGDTYNMIENKLDPTNINLSLKYKELKIRAIYDNYHTTTRDFFGSNLSKSYTMDFKTYLTEVSYLLKINNKFSISPTFNFKKDIPWNSQESPAQDENSDYYIYNRSVSRYNANLTTSYIFNSKIDLAFGVDYSYDFAEDHTEEGENLFWNGKKTIDYQNYAAYFQSNLNNKLFNLTIGARYDKHNQFGGAFVPRIAIMKRIKKINLKLLYNRAFKAPGIENIDKNYYLYQETGKPVIVPEITDVYNFELGCQLNPNIYLNTNIFRIDIKKAIVYFVSEDGVEGYDNLGKTGSQGLETEIKVKYIKTFLKLNYSFYTTKNINEIPDYAVPGNNSIFLGSPQHKLTLLMGYRLTEKFNFNFSAIYFSKQYGYNSYSETTDDVIIAEFEPIILTNIIFNFNNLFVKGLNLGIGVYNILDADFKYIQAYNGWHSPLPGQSREFIIKLNYNFVRD